MSKCVFETWSRASAASFRPHKTTSRCLHSRANRLNPRRRNCLERLTFLIPSIRRGYANEATTSDSKAAESQPNFFAVSDQTFGQPVHETHPHILRAGELTPGITSLEYHSRRQALAASLPQGGVALLKSADLKYRSGSVFYPFHQDSNFLYLTGWTEQDSVCTIERVDTAKGDVDYVFRMWVRERNEKEELWEGARSGVDAAKEVWNADEAFTIASIERTLPKHLASAQKVYTDIPLPQQASSNSSSGIISRLFPTSPSGTHSQLLSSIENLSSKTRPLAPLLNDLRAIKSPNEIALMRKIGQLSGRVLTSSMKQDWTTEKDLADFIEYNFRKEGGDGSAYVPVVAGGKNALSIHYVANNAVLHPSSLVLVDAGAEIGGYITDITRTFPASGRFTAAQRDLYDAVLSTQRHCVSLCRGNLAQTLDGLHSIAEGHLRENLNNIGFDLSKSETIQLMPHHLGHYVGMDVHDTPGYSRRTTLRKGHVITIEPGVYVLDQDRWPKHFRNMGIRIEDSVAIDDDSPIVLTSEAVKEIDDIEALRS